jgi:uncharacterized protein HemX
MAIDDTTPSGKTGKIGLPIPPPPAPPDPTSLLQSLQRIVETNKANKTPEGGGKSWVGTALIAAAVAIGVAVFSVIDWWRSRQLAKLRFERDKEKIEAQNAVMQQAVSQNTSRVIDLRKQFSEIDRNMEGANARIRQLEAQQSADQQAISAIRSWRDAVPPGHDGTRG